MALSGKKHQKQEKEPMGECGEEDCIFLASSSGVSRPDAASGAGRGAEC